MKSKFGFYIKLVGILLVVLSLVLYFFYQSRDYFLGPRIILKHPVNGQAVSERHLFLRGKTVNTSNFLVDGRVVLTDTLGNFETDLLLAEGYNIINLTARDKFGRERKKKLEIVLK